MVIYGRLLVFGICICICLLTEGIVYLGCYDDRNTRVLQPKLSYQNKNTPARCASRCSEFRYAGVESGEECFCGNTLNNPTIRPESECNYFCPGQSSEICGGHWRISVYTNWVTACGPPPAISNGNATLPRGSNFTYGSIADVFCNPGFISTPTITCLSNTSWEKATCEQSEYYITTSTNTWNNVPDECQLAQPEYDHKYDTGKTILRRNITINATLRHDLWIGYFKTLTEFEYHGCSQLSTPYFRNVTSLVDCHYACDGSYFGLHFASNKLKCTCMYQLPAVLTNTSCNTRGDFVCGINNTQAIYRFRNDTSSTTKNLTTIANLCKGSSAISNDSSWIKCQNNTKNVWCRNVTSRVPFVSGLSFPAWNTANDYCANNDSLPSTAIGYNGTNFTYMAFTNIFRNWTLQQGNGSISGGPMMFAYVSPNSTELKFSTNATESKKILCLWPKPTSTTSIPVTSPSNSTTNVQTSGTTYTSGDTAPTITKATSPDTTTSVSTTDGQPAASNQQASKESSTTAVSAGVSGTVAIAVSAVVIVLVLRNRKKFCFANTKRSNLDNRADGHNISLQNDLYQAPGAPVINHSYSGLDIGNIKSMEHEASPFTDVTYQNTNSKHGYHVSEAHAYFVLEKDEFEQQSNAAKTIPTDVHDYFVLEKQLPNVGNRNDVSTNEVHPYFVLEKDGDQPVHNRHQDEAKPYFLLEKQNTDNPPPIHSANALDLENSDRDMYQEIDTDDTYAGIDDSREDNNDYDYTNKAFKDSRTEFSDNVYNHLNSAGDEYDRVGKGQNNVEAMENYYDVTSSAIRK